MFVSLFTTDKNLVVKTEREKTHFEDRIENGKILKWEDNIKMSLKGYTKYLCN
jgi:hypothetical protein